MNTVKIASELTRIARALTSSSLRYMKDNRQRRMKWTGSATTEPEISIVQYQDIGESGMGEVTIFASFKDEKSNIEEARKFVAILTEAIDKAEKWKEEIGKPASEVIR